MFNAAQFWDGRARTWGAGQGPIQNSVEIQYPQLVEQTLGSIRNTWTPSARPSPQAGKPVSFDNMALAIEAYEATLVTPDSPFDLYLQGDDKALDAQQKKGLKAFMDSGCSACHNGINLGGQAYFPFGLVKKPDASAAQRRQGPLRRDQDPERRVRIPRRACATSPSPRRTSTAAGSGNSRTR